jgi:hypothetical protein
MGIKRGKDASVCSAAKVAQDAVSGVEVAGARLAHAAREHVGGVREIRATRRHGPHDHAGDRLEGLLVSAKQEVLVV